MNTYTQTLPLNKLKNISYPEKSLTLFISNLSESHYNEIMYLTNTYPSIIINVFITESKLSFLYRNSINTLITLEKNKVNISICDIIEEDLLIIDETIRIPIIYFEDSINLNTSKVITITPIDISNIGYITLDSLFNISNSLYIDIISSLTSSDIEKLLESMEYSHLELTSYDIPQFSNFDNSTITLINVLSNIETPLNYNDVGLLLTDGNKKDGAYKKYGENQSKTGELLELVSISSNVPKTVSLTSLGKLLLTVEEDIFKKVIFFEILKSKFIKYLLSLCKTNDKVNVKDICLNILSEKTYIRRRSNMKHLINILKSQEIESLTILLDKLIFN